MPSLTFPDFEAYSDSFAGVDGEMRITGRADGPWILDTLELGDVVLLHGRDGAPVLYRGASHAGQFAVYLSLPGNETELEGQRVGEADFTWMAPGVEMQGFTRVPARFLGIIIAEALVVEHADRLGLPVAGLYRNATLHSSLEAVDEVRALAWRALEVHAHDAAAFAAPSARHAFAAQISAAVLHCHLLTPTARDTTRRGRPPLPRKELVRRAIEHIQRSLRGEVAYSDVAFAVGASQRSINRAFDDIFGMAPHQFYLVERLHAIRSALRSAVPGDTVTSVCGRFGVWDLGRMATLYARLFHLQPAQELARALAGQGEGTVVVGRRR